MNVHSDDPITATHAAKISATSRDRDLGVVAMAFYSTPGRESWADKIAVEIGRDHMKVRRRVSDLKQLGWLQPTTADGVTVEGQGQMIHRLTDVAVHAIERWGWHK